MKGTLGFFGTGIWPYRISDVIGARNMSVNFGNSTVMYLTRDYVAILYFPFIPLRLSALVDYGSRRISLDKKGKTVVVGATQSVYGTRSAMREGKLAWLRKSWLLAFVVAAIGAFAGYYSGGYFLHSWQPGLWTVLGGLLGCCVLNIIFLITIH
ncbi:MAG: hypothetical protein ABIJ65_11820 [Chloroflexota bacterium]